MLSFLTKSSLSGIDEMGLLSRMVKIVTEDYSINIKNINFETTEGIFEGTISLNVYSVDDLNVLINNLLKIDGLKTVKRIQ